MNRAHWQTLAEERILAAQALLAAHLWSSAYYVAGYGVEFGLKSCILVHVVNTGVIFKERKFSEQCWSHSVEDLVRLAGLDGIRRTGSAANPALGDNWSIASAWNEKSRYDIWTQVEAETLYNAITDRANGVLPWIQTRW